jgi:hypothetical protein
MRTANCEKNTLQNFLLASLASLYNPYDNLYIPYSPMAPSTERSEGVIGASRPSL